MIPLWVTKFNNGAFIFFSFLHEETETRGSSGTSPMEISGAKIHNVNFYTESSLENAPKTPF